MRFLNRILPFLAAAQPTALEPLVVLTGGEFAVDEEVKLELTSLRTTIDAREARERERAATVAAQLSGIQRDLGKLSREQFQATTLLEGQGASLDQLVEAWREQVGQFDRQTEQLRQTLADRDLQLRLSLVSQLLPIADALTECNRSARTLAAVTVASPAPTRARGAGLSALVTRIVGTNRSLPVAVPSAAMEAWLEGLQLVERRLLAFLDREGVRPIPSVGETFDPYRHLAVAISHDRDLPDGTVVSEELRGYSIGNRVLRPAEVVVARREKRE